MNALSPAFFRSYLIWAAASVATGWSLAAFNELNLAGYTVAWPLAALGLNWLLRDKICAVPAIHRRCPKIWRRRFRRPLPLIFAVAGGMALLGGILHAPNNFDAVTYRLPRMLNWFQAGTWFWIPTFDLRMNFSGTVWEWMAMPFLVLLRTDRVMFLINLLGFVMMPGLLFSIFRQAGVARRLAWTWMWILPLAYGYATQAGSIGNDLCGAVFCLLSVHFGLRARRSEQVSDAWLAVLAAALMTGEKLSNLPLALPCLVALWPMLGRMLKHLPGTLAVAGVAVTVSAIPTMALNQLHTGGWTGDPQNVVQAQVNSPAAALLGNGLLLAEQSFMPPLLPGARKLQEKLDRRLPSAWHRLLKEKYPRYYLSRLNEIPGEDSAGLGLGITLLLAGGVVATAFQIGRRSFSGTISKLFPPVALAAWIATAVYLLKMGSEGAPRLLLPYYPLLLIPFILLPAQRRLVNHRLWRVFLLLTALSVLPAMVLSVSRPLWPARSVTAWLARSHPDSQWLQRLAASYETYGHRNDVLAPIRSRLPADAREIGFIAGSNDSDYSLWRPFGQRRVICLRSSAGTFVKPPDGMEWVVVKENEWPGICQTPLAEWATAHQFKIIFSTEIVELVSWGPETWVLLHRVK